jgi:hypothetical protein
VLVSRVEKGVDLDLLSLSPAGDDLPNTAVAVIQK